MTQIGTFTEPFKTSEKMTQNYSYLLVYEMRKSGFSSTNHKKFGSLHSTVVKPAGIEGLTPGFSSCLNDFLNGGPFTYEPRREKTGLRGFRPGPTQTGLYSLRSRLEA